MAAVVAAAAGPPSFSFSTTNRASPLSKFKRQSFSVSSSSSTTPLLSHTLPRKRFTHFASVSAAPRAPPPEVKSRPNDLVAFILSKVAHTDRGVLLTREEHKIVDEIAQELQKYCIDAPVKCTLIFGANNCHSVSQDWDVVYCSNPTSPGGGYRSALGRFVFKTKEMIQVVDAPDIIRNKVSFCAFGFIDGQVSLKGKFAALDESWIQVVFEPPKLKVGGFEFQYGGESKVKLKITYIDEKIRLGKGSRGSLFVFQRCG